MNTHDEKPAAPNRASAGKRVYQTPRVTDLGDVRELTRGNASVGVDGKGHPGGHG